MFQPKELFIGLRYIRAKRKSHFVSFIAFISIGGVALGVFALIVVLSVMVLLPCLTFCCQSRVVRVWQQNVKQGRRRT